MFVPSLCWQNYQDRQYESGAKKRRFSHLNDHAATGVNVHTICVADAVHRGGDAQVVHVYVLTVGRR